MTEARMLTPVARHDFGETPTFRVRPLPDGRWAAVGGQHATIFDDQLKLQRQWEFEPGGPVSVNDTGDMAAVARYPDVEVQDQSGLVATFKSPVPETWTTVQFHDRHVYFMAYDSDLDAGEWVLLMRASLDTLTVERVGSTSIVSCYDFLPRRPSIPGVFVTAWDGQHGARTAYFADGERGVGERIGSDGYDWSAVFDVSPDGTRYLEGGTSCKVRTWPDHVELPLNLPPDLESPAYQSSRRNSDLDHANHRAKG